MAKVMRPEDLLLAPQPQSPQHSTEIHSSKERSTTLSNGTIMRFRPPKLKDVRELQQQFGQQQFEMSCATVVRLCIKFGDRDGIVPEQFDEFDWEDAAACFKVMEFFLGEAPTNAR